MLARFSSLASIPASMAILALCGAAISILGCATTSTPSHLPIESESTSASHFPSRGIEVASSYGPGFAGRSTSSGETFNPNGLTAASKTLPLGSRVRVTNPDNGRSVVVRINDRGPFVNGRSLDLSRRAAQRIGLTGKGVGRVRIATVGAPSYSDATVAPPAVRRTIYPVRSRNSIRRTVVSNPVGAWLASTLFP